jgi:hypothetical protein
MQNDIPELRVYPLKPVRRWMITKSFLSMKKPSSALRHFVFLAMLVVAIPAMAAPSVDDSNPPSSSRPMANPENSATGPVLPAGYALLNASDDGQIFCVDLPRVADVRNALESAFLDLARIFGQRPIPEVAYEDNKDHRSGGATFSVAYHGRAAQGLVTCKLIDQGAHVVALFRWSDAPAGASARLSSVLTSADAPASVPPSESEIHLTPYYFPDRTGSIGVADGWTANAQSIFRTIRIDGPNEGNVTLGMVLAVDMPGSQADRLAEHFHAKHFVAPFSDPVTAVTDLWPQVSRANQAAGGPAVQIDRILSADPLQTTRPEEKAALLVFDVIRTRNGKSGKYRTAYVTRMATIPQQPGHWQLTMRGFSAPVANFDQDAPTMLAMFNSLKVDETVTARVGQAIVAANEAAAAASLEAFRQRGIQQQKNHDAYMAGQNAQRDKRLAAFNAGQLRKSRNNSDQVEAILNVTKIVDTQTGRAAQVRGTDADAILNTLNGGQQGRFQQLHLRDELYPIQKP